MSQINVNVVAPLGYTGPDLPGDNNFVQVVDVNGDCIFKSQGSSNLSIGLNSLANLTSGFGNLGIGESTALNVETSSLNTFLGHEAGSAFNISSTGNNNTAIGALAGYNVLGSDNTLLGYNAGGINSVSGNNNICLGVQSTTATLSSNNSITLGNSSHTVIRAAVTSITSLSDERDKKEIQELPVGLEFVEKLKPVKFLWNDRDESGKHDVEDFGFIAQDLKAAQEESKAGYLNLVYDENPEKLEASYGKLLPVLVKAIQEMSSEIKLLKEEILTLKTK